MERVSTGDEQAERDRKGRWKAGESGNPRGRPKGARNRASVIVRELLDDAAGEVMKRVIAQAKRGNAVAMRLVVERLLPRAGREVRAEVPELAEAADVAHTLERIVSLAAAGEISLDEAQGFARLCELRRRAIETEELRVRIQALEGAPEDDVAY